MHERREYLIIHDRCEVGDGAKADVSQLPHQHPGLLDKLDELHRTEHEVPHHQDDHHLGPSDAEEGVVETDHLHRAAGCIVGMGQQFEEFCGAGGAARVLLL